MSETRNRIAFRLILTAGISFLWTYFSSELTERPSQLDSCSYVSNCFEFSKSDADTELDLSIPSLPYTRLWDSGKTDMNRIGRGQTLSCEEAIDRLVGFVANAYSMLKDTWIGPWLVDFSKHEIVPIGNCSPNEITATHHDHAECDRVSNEENSCSDGGHRIFPFMFLEAEHSAPSP